MAKYCAKCGKALPDGVEICPDCHVTAREDGAAPFTRMTAETEVWKTPEDGKKKKRPKRERTKEQKQTIAYIAAAAAVVVIAVALILFFRPQNRVARALRAGEYERARSLYWSEQSLASGAHDAQIEKAVLQAAESVLDAFDAHEISAEDAADALSRLGAIGQNGEALLTEAVEDFRALSVSREHYAQGEKLTLNGDFLGAREEYLQVIERDADYADAREKAEASLDRYTESVISDASVYIQSGDYASAIEALETGKRVLLDYDLYSEKVGYKLTATYELFEENLLKEAENLAALGDYASAAELLRQNMERFGYETESLTAAVDGYLDQAKDQTLAETVLRADRLYDEGSYAAAFALLEDMLDEAGDKADVDAAVTALESRYAADMAAEAEEIFSNTRENLPEAIAALETALEVRELEDIRAYLEDLSRYLPASLAEMEVASLSGTVFRQGGVFEALDGTEYGDGWIWGGAGAEVSFALNGAYDLLEGTLTFRRDDKVSTNGRFEVWCDGELVYTSPQVNHPYGKAAEISVDVSGCDTLTLRFINDYSVQTSDGGYCYHGFCTPTLTKDLPGAAAETDGD